MRSWRTDLLAQADPHGRVTPALQRTIATLEKKHGPAFTPGARAAFQTIAAQLGARLVGPLQMPEDDTPYWLMGEHPLADHRSTERLPERADVVVIGAGLTGASTAWHLSRAAAKGLRVVVIEAGDPATQASGRNGGNFELMPENFLGEDEGLPRERWKWLRRRYPRVRAAILQREADRQARLVFEFGSRNTKALLKLVAGTRIDCDLSDAGWLRIADTAREERGIEDEVRFAQAMGIGFEMWSPSRIRRELAIPARWSGRLARPNGNYHPFKFVCGALAASMRRGVNLQTRTPVIGIRTRRGDVVVETTRGSIRTGRVVFATNAFTSTLLPELEAIRYFQSQIMNLEHVRDTMRGMTDASITRSRPTPCTRSCGSTTACGSLPIRQVPEG